MTADRGSDQLRGYLLGRASEENASAIEKEYFESETAGDRIAEGEEALIEEYLDGQMAAEDRGAFERVYLASPRHRERVEMIRQLTLIGSRTRNSPAARGSVWGSTAWGVGALGLAAAILFAVVVQRSNAPSNVPANAGGEATTSPPAHASRGESETRGRTPPAGSQRTFAVTLSPIAVRAAGVSTALVIPDGTTVVAVDLEADNGPPLAAGRAQVRTVSGVAVWEGPATAPSRTPTPVLARIEIPADRLRSDDYIITLFASDGAGTERARYVLRVRNR